MKLLRSLNSRFSSAKYHIEKTYLRNSDSSTLSSSKIKELAPFVRDSGFNNECIDV